MRVSAILAILVFAGTLWAGQAPATGKKTATKEARWQGHIVRVDSKDSRLIVRGGQANMENIERQIYYDNSTEWTKQGKPAEQSEFKEGEFVIVLGHADKKGIFHATRVDLRMPR